MPLQKYSICRAKQSRCAWFSLFSPVIIFFGFYRHCGIIIPHYRYEGKNIFHRPRRPAQADGPRRAQNQTNLPSAPIQAAYATLNVGIRALKRFVI